MLQTPEKPEVESSLDLKTKLKASLLGAVAVFLISALIHFFVGVDETIAALGPLEFLLRGTARSLSPGRSWLS